MPTFKLGRKRPAPAPPALDIAPYIKTLPPPPPAVSYAAAAHKALSQIYGNDNLGDCVIATIAHIEGVLTANSNPPPLIYTHQEIIHLYSAIGGYVPGNPNTDEGCDEITAMHYWRQKGAPSGSHRIAGYIAVDPRNQQYKAALWLFENLVFGLELPDAWVNPFPSESGFIWDVVGPPNPDNGHAVAGVGYDDKGVYISSWGMLGLMTDAAIAEYIGSAEGGALYVVLSQDVLNRATQKAPTGFDWPHLVHNFNSMGGNLSLPKPYLVSTSKAGLG